MINFSTLQGLTIPEGVVTQITDAAGNVLWSSTITFTINGDTYVADRSMTWAEWFASSHNTTGKTANDVQSISANGTAVALNAIIVGGMAYDIVFAEMVTVTITGAGNANYCYILIDGVSYATATSLAVPVGTTITAFVAGRECDCGRDGGQNTIRINDLYYYTSPKDYTVEKNVTINLFYESDDCKDCDDSWRDCFIQIIET